MVNLLDAQKIKQQFTMSRPWYLGLVLLCWLLPMVASAACPLPQDTKLPAPKGDELLVASQNAWLFHDENKDFRYDKAIPKRRLAGRINAFAQYIIDDLAAPHILALQEVENRPLLQRLVKRIANISEIHYQIHFLANQDMAGNAVALLSRAPITVGRADATFKGLKVPKSRHSSLFSRLPLEIEVKQPLPMRLLVVHLRSANGLNGKQQTYVRHKRRGQAQALIRWARQQSGDYLILGDFNSSPGRGAFSEPWRLLQQAGWREALPRLPVDQTPFTYVHRCQKQQLDHIYLSAGLHKKVTRSTIAHGSAGHYKALYRYHGSRVVSDHDAIGVYLTHEESAPE